MKVFFCLFISGCTALISAGAVAYQPSSNQPNQAQESLQQLENLGVEENLGGSIDLDLEFTDQNGQVVPLKTYFGGTRPVLLTMVYYGCPSLCNYHLNGLMKTFKDLRQPVGSDFQVVAVSMNHREDHELAAAKLETYLNELDQPTARGGMHFLVGSEKNVAALAGQLGFKFRWDPVEEQYAHPAAAYVVTPNGVISRYLYGIEFSAKTLRLSLVEAAQGKIGNLIEQVILFCFQFNPGKNKYTLYSYNLMRAGGLFTVVLLGIVLLPMWMREKRKSS